MCGGERKILFDLECRVLKFELILITYTYFPIVQHFLELKSAVNLLNPEGKYLINFLPIFDSYFFNHSGWNTYRNNIIWNVTINKTMSPYC